jgi:hypothetical protein
MAPMIWLAKRLIAAIALLRITNGDEIELARKGHKDRMATEVF